MNAQNTSDMEQIVGYEYEVKGPHSREWNRHFDFADDVPEDPAEAWRDDHRVRNVRPLVYADNVDETAAPDTTGIERGDHQ